MFVCVCVCVCGGVRFDRLIVVLETHIHIYELPYVELLHSIDTALNPRGLCALAAGDSCRIAFPRHGTNGTCVCVWGEGL